MCIRDRVIAVEKKLSSILIDESSMNKIMKIDEHLGAIYSGLGPDFRVLMLKARKLCQEHKMKYGENIQVSNICRETAQIVQEYTQSGGVRPFGISTLVAGVDVYGPHLYQLDPSGAYYEWKATAIGRNMKNAKTILEKRYSKDISLEDAIHTALFALKDGFEGQMTNTNIEIGVITDSTKLFKILSPAEIKDYLEEFE
eukprot:TRINITY_DN0_c1669_g1_i1.p1 TRINITY_DN0_c1669_g1~~TRINITY_DN0_c1669_g1_i1.p1  ORF type:complete len:199 (-),score=45.89 TRINITY_DN0_c1669_g1_i1:50-646(-)